MQAACDHAVGFMRRVIRVKRVLNLPGQFVDERDLRNLQRRKCRFCTKDAGACRSRAMAARQVGWLFWL